MDKSAKPNVSLSASCHAGFSFFLRQMDIIPPDNLPPTSDCSNPTIPSFQTYQRSVWLTLPLSKTQSDCWAGCMASARRGERESERGGRQSGQRTHPRQHQKCKDRHHKWLNSQWLHLEGKGGGGQERGCLTARFARKGHSRMEGRREGVRRREGVNYILKGLHQLCEGLAHLSLYPVCDESAGAPVDSPVQHTHILVQASKLLPECETNVTCLWVNFLSSSCTCFTWNKKRKLGLFKQVERESSFLLTQGQGQVRNLCHVITGEHTDYGGRVGFRFILKTRGFRPKTV